MVELEFGDVGFCGGRKTGEPGEKFSEQGENLQQTQPTYHCVMIPIPTPIEDGLHNILVQTLKMRLQAVTCCIVVCRHSYESYKHYLVSIAVFPQLYFHMVRQRKKVIGRKDKPE